MITITINPKPSGRFLVILAVAVLLAGIGYEVVHYQPPPDHSSETIEERLEREIKELKAKSYLDGIDRYELERLEHDLDRLKRGKEAWDRLEKAWAKNEAKPDR